MGSAFQQNAYNAYGGYGQPAPGEPLQFFNSGPADSYGGAYGSRGLEGELAPGISSSVGGSIQGGFWSAFTPSGFPDEPPLLEELGINFDHIKTKTLTVLNPFRAVDHHIMDEADLAGPLIYCFTLGLGLLLSGRSVFGYLYGTGLLGTIALFTLLNLMSPAGIDAYRVAGVLGYCLLPLVFVSLASVFISMDGLIGYVLAALSIFWCSYSASGIFVSVLNMSHQRLLVAYPTVLFYASFALLTVFSSSSGGASASASSSAAAAASLAAGARAAAAASAKAAAAAAASAVTAKAPPAVAIR